MTCFRVLEIFRRYLCACWGLLRYKKRQENTFPFARPTCHGSTRGALLTREKLFSHPFSRCRRYLLACTVAHLLSWNEGRSMGVDRLAIERPLYSIPSRSFSRFFIHFLLDSSNLSDARAFPGGFNRLRRRPPMPSSPCYTCGSLSRITSCFRRSWLPYFEILFYFRPAVSHESNWYCRSANLNFLARIWLFTPLVTSLCVFSFDGAPINRVP